MRGAPSPLCIIGGHVDKYSIPLCVIYLILFHPPIPPPPNIGSSLIIINFCTYIIYILIIIKNLVLKYKGGARCCAVRLLALRSYQLAEGSSPA